MEILRVKRDQINDQAWDDCIRKHANGLPYALCGYLDQVTSRRWEALISSDYEYVFPLPFEKKLSLLFYIQPFLTQQLGLFGPQLTEAVIHQFLSKLPKSFSALYLKFNEESLISPSENYSIKPRTNLLLSLETDYNQISQNYSKSLRKRVRQSGEKYLYTRVDDPNTIVDYYREQLERRIQLGAAKYKIARRLLSYLSEENLGFGVAAISAKGNIDACLFLINFQGRIINLFGASNDSGRKHSAMHFLMDAVIREKAQTATYFDFEGSDIPGVKSFYLSFGAFEKKYMEVNWERLPWWYRLVRRLRGNGRNEGE